MVAFRVQGSLRGQHGVLLWGYKHLVVEDTVLDDLHVYRGALFHGILQDQDAFLALDFNAHIGVLQLKPTITLWSHRQPKMEVKTSGKAGSGAFNPSTQEAEAGGSL